MRCNLRSLAAVPLFILALILLRQGIVATTQALPFLDRQVQVMQDQDIDPAALFYTDSRVALRAIQRARQKVH